MNLRTLAVVVVSMLLLAMPTRADDASVPEGLAANDWSSIRAAYEAGRHAVVADEVVPGHYRARNPGQQWLTHFDGRGFSTTPQTGGWSWGLDLISYGRGDAQQTIDGTACVQTTGGRVEYEWSPSLTEWYINDQRGFEHGYTLKHRPDGTSATNGPNGPRATSGSPGGMLHFTLAVRGDLHPRVSENGRDVAFTTTRGVSDGGATAVSYNNLKVFDADGVHLAASFQATTTPTGTPALLLTIDDTNARYPLTIDPVAQQAYLKMSHVPSSNAGRFGRSIAVSGDTVVVGGYLGGSNLAVVGDQGDTAVFDTAAVYVFVRSGTTWTQQGYLFPAPTGGWASSGFGGLLAISGDTVVIGGNGNPYIFTRTGTAWTLQARLPVSASSLAVSGDTIVIGSILDPSGATGVNGNQADTSAPGAGAAFVFTRSGTTWTQQAYLKASNTGAGDNFGSSVAISGDTIIVGAPLEDSTAGGVNNPNSANNTAADAGAAYIFARAPGGTTWSQQAYVKALYPSPGDRFGESVAASADTVVVGTSGEDSNATGVNGVQFDNSVSNSGAAWVFSRSPGGTNWSQRAYLKASNTGAGDGFGRAVAISGDTIVVGAGGEDSNATGVNGNQADNSAWESGAAYVFVRSGTTWTQQAYLKASNTGGGRLNVSGDSFGLAIGVSGNTVVVGAMYEASSSWGINGNETDNGVEFSGAAYVLVRASGTTSWSQQAYLKSSPTVRVFSNSGDYFGSSIAISGDTVVIGAPGDDSGSVGVNGFPVASTRLSSGAAYVFVRSGSAWTQQAYLKPSRPNSYDRFGSSVAISGDTVVVGAYGESSSATGVNGNEADISFYQSGAAYVFVRSGTIWSQQAYLKASNTGAGDYFGSAVAVSGDTVVVGAPLEDSNATGVNGDQANNSIAGSSSGATYVYVRSGTTWTQQAYLKASNTGAGDYFGSAVAISGDTIAVGALDEDSIATGVNGDQANNTAQVSGAAYVFVRSGTTWTQQAYLKASNTDWYDHFGSSVAVSGDTVVVGASAEDSNATGVNGANNNNASNSGAAYVFVRSGTTWTQQAYLKASNPEADDRFGSSVDISGDTVVVGAHLEDSNAAGVNGNQADNSVEYSGAAYVFVRSGTNWAQQAYLKASNTDVRDIFGVSVAVSGDTVVVGALDEDSHSTGVNGNQANNTATDSGAAYVFLLPLPTPTSPLAAPVTVCGGAPVALSVADPVPGIVIDWFANSCGGTLLGTGNPFIVNPVSTTTYFARARNPSSGSTSDACAAVVVTVGRMDYNRDAALNLDDVADFITDFYMDPPIPGGLQPVAPTYADITLGYGIVCPGAADASAPYDINAYRASGYRVGFSTDGSNSCPISPDQNFPNLDHLADFITEYYAAFTAAGC